MRNLRFVGSAVRSVIVKANEFIKKFGLKLAQRDIAALDSGFIKREDFLEHYGFDILDDLKRLVESYELVESKGGIELSKKEVRQRSIVRWVDPEVERLREAIADVESCQ